jgi:methylenetetrahydrofolate reductase (NADPH)
VTTTTETKDHFAQALHSPGVIVTAECRPPRGADQGAITRLAASLPGVVSALVVSENHEEIRASALSCAVQLLRENVEPILTLVVRDRNRIALQSDVLGAAALGITSVLCLSGDHQSLGVSPTAAGAYDLDPMQLLLALKAMRDDGVLLGGERLEKAPALCLGAIAHPALRPMPLNLLQTRKKIAAGAQFLLTQPVWDVNQLSEWMSAVRAAGLNERAHILASVRPLTGVEEAEAIEARHRGSIPESVLARIRKSTDPVKEGIAIGAELAARAKDVQGVRGIHVVSGDRGDQVLPALLEQAGLKHA